MVQDHKWNGKWTKNVVTSCQLCQSGSVTAYIWYMIMKMSTICYWIIVEWYKQTIETFKSCHLCYCGPDTICGISVWERNFGLSLFFSGKKIQTGEGFWVTGRRDVIYFVERLRVWCLFGWQNSSRNQAASAQAKTQSQWRSVWYTIVVFELAIINLIISDASPLKSPFKNFGNFNQCTFANCLPSSNVAAE